MARWKVAIHFKLADSESVTSSEFVVDDEGRRRIEDWQQRYARGESTNLNPSLDFPTADGGNQFFSPHSIRRVELRPG